MVHAELLVLNYSILAGIGLTLGVYIVGYALNAIDTCCKAQEK